MPTVTEDAPTTVRPPAVDHRIDDGSGSGHDGRWKVIVLNDNHNTFQGVAGFISQYIPGCDYAKGMDYATKIHNQGQAIVWTGAKEVAELYWEQLRGCGLTMAPLEQ